MKVWYAGLTQDERVVIDFRIQLVRQVLQLPADLDTWPTEQQEGLKAYLAAYRQHGYPADPQAPEEGGAIRPGDSKDRRGGG